MNRMYNHAYKNKSYLINEIKLMLSELCLNSFYKENSTRSKHRTDLIHNRLKQMITQSLPPMLTESEEVEILTDTSKKNSKIKDAYGGFFSADIIIKIFGEIRFSISVKAPVTSINKNKQNYMNTAIGEAHRVLSTEDSKNNLKYVHITFSPEKAFQKQTGNIIKGIEEVKTYQDDSINKNMYKLGYVGANSSILNVKYSISSDLISDMYIGQNAIAVGEEIKNRVDNNKTIIEDVNVTPLLQLIEEIEELHKLKREALKSSYKNQLDADELINKVILGLSKKDIISYITYLYLKESDQYIPEINKIIDNNISSEKEKENIINGLKIKIGI